jgi:hypothetical protein
MPTKRRAVMTPPKLKAPAILVAEMDQMSAPRAMEVEGKMALARRVPGMEKVM